MADVNDLEQDVVLQRASADLIADLETTLRPFLWKTTTSGELKIRRRVRWRDLGRLEEMLDQFQELPQLLDPHLDKFIPLLANSFLAYLRLPPSKQPVSHPELLVPVYKAICRLLYRFCKVRGEKIIVRFFSTETKHIELLLSSIEAGTRPIDVGPVKTEGEKNESVWNWEETYVTLLWLSQLLLAPFDLVSISSESFESTETYIAGFTWPENTPGVTLRVIPLAARFLESPGKERDAAKVLLVRIAMRKDMQELGIMDALVRWALNKSQNLSGSSVHSSLGLLSFIAGLLVSSTGTTDMDSHLASISNLAHEISSTDTPQFVAIRSSAVARKTIIKILRTATVILLQRPESMANSEAIEFTISHLLESLADQSTPVRLAASKALSIVTLKLPSDMATQVVDEVLSTFERSVFLKLRPGDLKKTRDLSRVNSLEWHGLVLTLSHLIYRRSIPVANLSSILRALRLGLSFNQRSTSGSPIGSNVRDAACFGIWALARRYTTKELESLKIDPDVFSERETESEGSTLQILATELVVSASLDPAGNIRRGSSAALQELIGRHPDMIAEGIQVVQVVDYHAVALRSKAVEEVAIQAAKLSEYYYRGLLRALLGWRGVQDPDPIVRRVAASSIGLLVDSESKRFAKVNGRPDDAVITDALQRIVSRIPNLALREEEERHGLILSFAAITKQTFRRISNNRFIKDVEDIPTRGGDPDDQDNLNAHILDIHPYSMLPIFLRHVVAVMQALNKPQLLDHSKKLSLLLEAASTLIVANCPLLRLDMVLRGFDIIRRAAFTQGNANDQISLLELLNVRSFAFKIPSAEVKRYFQGMLTTASLFGDYQQRVLETTSQVPDIQPYKPLFELEQGLVREFMANSDTETADLVSLAAADLLLAHPPVLDLNLPVTVDNLLNHFAFVGKVLVPDDNAKEMHLPGRQGKGSAYLQFFFRIAWPDELNTWSARIFHFITAKFTAPTAVPNEIELKLTILKCMVNSEALLTRTEDCIDVITRGLDDYSTDARGDIGSMVRIEALKVVAAFCGEDCSGLPAKAISSRRWYLKELLPRVMRAASEKLDRVRIEAKKALLAASHFTGVSTTEFVAFEPSSKEYFRWLLDFEIQAPDLDETDWRNSFMLGLITAADTGSEDIIRASRGALAEYCSEKQENINHISSSLFSILYDSHENTSDVDRISIPCLEVMAFLFDMGVLQNAQCLNDLSASSWDWNTVLRAVIKAQLNSTNIRKIEAAIKCYGPLAEVLKNAPPETNGEEYDWMSNNAFKRLNLLLGHRYPKIRSCAADEIFIRTGMGKSIDWGYVKKKAMKPEETYLILKGKPVE